MVTIIISVEKKLCPSKQKRGNKMFKMNHSFVHVHVHTYMYIHVHYTSTCIYMYIQLCKSRSAWILKFPIFVLCCSTVRQFTDEPKQTTWTLSMYISFAHSVLKTKRIILTSSYNLFDIGDVKLVYRKKSLIATSS